MRRQLNANQNQHSEFDARQGFRVDTSGRYVSRPLTRRRQLVKPPVINHRRLVELILLLVGGGCSTVILIDTLRQVFQQPG